MWYVSGIWILAPAPGPRCEAFFIFFGWVFQKHARGLFAADSCCLLNTPEYFVFFHVSFSAKVYASGPHGCRTV